MNTQENNKLIAEFMGVVFHDDENQYYNADGLHIGNTLQYHNSWDWLMPVIIKMADAREDTHYKLYKTIDEAYEEVVEFINQLNN